MIVVRVELWSAITGAKTEIARLDISNLGGTRTHGDYGVRVYRGRSAKALDRSMLKQTTARRADVLNHPRLAAHVWNLVAKALVAANYGGRHERVRKPKADWV